MNDKLKEILQSIKIISDSSYAFKGTVYYESRKVNYKKNNSLDDIISENTSILDLETLLYRIYHCRRNLINENNQYMKIYSDNRDFINELSQNNSGTGMWESGWRIVKIENNGQIAAFKNDLTVWLNRQYFRLKHGDRGKLKVGKYGYVMMPKEFCHLLPGFYMVNGNELQEENNNDILVRLYWNIQNSHSWMLVKLMSNYLNKLRVPFRFKILSYPIGYPRADAAVLYIHKEFYKKAENSLKNIYLEIKNFLNSFTPMFAKTMAPGLSLAEDPRNGESFGLNRSRLLAQSLYSIQKENVTSLEKMVEKIDLNFKKSNINIYYPFLNPSSIDDYSVFDSSVEM